MNSRLASVWFMWSGTILPCKGNCEVAELLLQAGRNGVPEDVVILEGKPTDSPEESCERGYLNLFIQGWPNLTEKTWNWKALSYIEHISTHLSHSPFVIPRWSHWNPTCLISARRRPISILVGVMGRALCKWLQSETTWRWLAYWWKLKQIWIAPADMAEVLSKSLVNVGIWRHLGGFYRGMQFFWLVTCLGSKVEGSGNGEAHAVVLLSRTVICLIAFDLLQRSVCCWLSGRSAANLSWSWCESHRALRSYTSTIGRSAVWENMKPKKTLFISEILHHLGCMKPHE